MPTIVVPDIDKSTIEELRKKLPNLSEIEFPKMELPNLQNVSKTADQTIDRLLGRQKAPVWPWVAAGIGLVAVIGAVAAYFAFWRRPSWESTSEPWNATTDEGIGVETSDSDASTGFDGTSTGLTAAESSLASNPYRTEEV